MIVGLANLVYLKSQLLAAVLRDGTDYDAPLTTIGKGVATQLENACQRKFARLEGAVEILPADYCQFLLERYPLESISKIELKLTEADGFVEKVINDYVRTIDLKVGIVNLPDGQDAGPWYARLRFTYTGGFWIDDTDDISGTVPEGQTELPADLRLAWVLQCREVWNKTDKSGVGIIEGMAEKVKIPSLSEIKLIPQVEQILTDYIRPNLV